MVEGVVHSAVASGVTMTTGGMTIVAVEIGMEIAMGIAMVTVMTDMKDGTRDATRDARTEVRGPSVFVKSTAPTKIAKLQEPL